MRSSFIRSLGALIVGALLVKYRGEAVTWLTIATGVVFFVSGLISCINYFVARNQAAKRAESDFQPSGISTFLLVNPSTFQLVIGVGCLILGLTLALMPSTFLTGLTYALAAILILSAIGQYVSLASATRFGPVNIGWWVMPTLLLLVGILVVVNPKQAITAPLFVIGWALMVYGVIEMANGLMIHRLRKRYETAVRKTVEQAAIETAEAEEVADDADDSGDEVVEFEEIGEAEEAEEAGYADAETVEESPEDAPED
ncbi:MAG: DUF308 domain-containing protein [Prevotella sp.]|nr:DUF308 domain-containing protein [Prevotella sp.]